ncbi:MAG TPA: hypothetical protein VMU82_11045 [Acetobacteraceae bacterium]|nr:hypothetical protein [Acetobacteraceae bacterium]
MTSYAANELATTPAWDQAQTDQWVVILLCAGGIALAAFITALRTAARDGSLQLLGMGILVAFSFLLAVASILAPLIIVYWFFWDVL